MLPDLRISKKGRFSDTNDTSSLADATGITGCCGRCGGGSGSGSGDGLMVCRCRCQRSPARLDGFNRVSGRGRRYRKRRKREASLFK